jgi:hypothetical protein
LENAPLHPPPAFPTAPTVPATARRRGCSYQPKRRYKEGGDSR